MVLEKGGRNRKKFHRYIFSVGEKKLENNVKDLTSHICICILLFILAF